MSTVFTTVTNGAMWIWSPMWVFWESFRPPLLKIRLAALLRPEGPRQAGSSQVRDPPTRLGPPMGCRLRANCSPANVATGAMWIWNPMWVFWAFFRAPLLKSLFAKNSFGCLAETIMHHGFPDAHSAETLPPVAAIQIPGTEAVFPIRFDHTSSHILSPPNLEHACA